MQKHLIQSTHPFVLAALLAAPLTFSPSVALAGETPKPQPAAGLATKVATTPEHHLAKAAEYKKKEAVYRAEAAMHRKMLEDYKELFLSERVDEDPFVTKMRIHCEGYIKDAEALAADAQKFADFHRMRAGELQGK